MLEVRRYCVETQLEAYYHAYGHHVDSLGKRLNYTPSMGCLKGEHAMVGRKPSMGAIMSVFVQKPWNGAEEQADENVRGSMEIKDAVPKLK